MECGQGSCAKQRVLGKERDGLVRLLVRRVMMMMKATDRIQFLHRKLKKLPRRFWTSLGRVVRRVTLVTKNDKSDISTIIFVQ